MEGCGAVSAGGLARRRRGAATAAAGPRPEVRARRPALTCRCALQENHERPRWPCLRKEKGGGVGIPWPAGRLLPAADTWPRPLSDLFSPVIVPFETTMLVDESAEVCFSCRDPAAALQSATRASDSTSTLWQSMVACSKPRVGLPAQVGRRAQGRRVDRCAVCTGARPICCTRQRDERFNCRRPPHSGRGSRATV